MSECRKKCTECCHLVERVITPSGKICRMGHKLASDLVQPELCEQMGDFFQRVV